MLHPLDWSPALSLLHPNPSPRTCSTMPFWEKDYGHKWLKDFVWGGGWSYVYVRGGSHFPPTVPCAAPLKISISWLTLPKGHKRPITGGETANDPPRGEDMDREMKIIRVDTESFVSSSTQLSRDGGAPTLGCAMRAPSTRATSPQAKGRSSCLCR